MTGKAEATEITNADDEDEPSTLRKVPKKRRHVSIALSERLNNVCHIHKPPNQPSNDSIRGLMRWDIISSSCRFPVLVILRNFIIVRI